jgi:UDP-N-acetylglucosamine--N-acetylmuramyl-(pentapeptide) pyrophosphoryl-undecaprenol N-acetylglucosamine transferase
MTRKKIVIATGGTGGHIFPALSLANYLKNHDYSIELITDKRGLRYLKDYDKINLKEIPSSPLIKKNIFRFLLSILVIVYSIMRTFLYFIFNRPSIVFGMGGYSSFPICIAASILRIKFIIYENNLIIGKANRYLLPLTKKIFVSYNDIEGISDKYKNKVCEVGNIIREEIIDLNNINNQKYINDDMKILILGGSQAAKVFADELPHIFEKLKKKEIKFKVFQQCQRDQIDQLSQFYKKIEIEHEIFYFTKNIVKYYSKANLVITRSGASVLGELINVKIPFISIPLPSSAENHQHKNAQFYVKKGYGYLIEEKDIKNDLYDLIYSISKKKISIKNILSNQSQYSDKNILQNIRNRIEEIINEKN